MKTTKTIIIEKAAQIILNKGLAGLTIHNLANELDIKEKQLHLQLSKDDDILQMLMLELEVDIIEFVKELAKKGVSPEMELKLLFKGLYYLFQQKPYYLSIIFDESIKDRDYSIKRSFLRIGNTAENYLTTIIEAGKKENIFKTDKPTMLLVGKMLSGFRGYMKDEQRVNELILELKTSQIFYTIKMKKTILSVLLIFLVSFSVIGQVKDTIPEIRLKLISQVNQGNSYITFPTDIGNIEHLWFEGNLIPNFYLRQSQNSRLMGVLTPQIIIHLYRKEMLISF